MYRKLFMGHTLFERKCDMLVASVFCHCKHLSCCALQARAGMRSNLQRYVRNVRVASYRF